MVRKVNNIQAKGQSLLEFALILPVLLIVVLGVIEFGRIFLLYTEASNAAREATRYGVAAGNSVNDIPRYLDCGEIRQAALSTTVLSNFDPITDTIQVAYDYPSGTSTQILGACEDGFSEDDIQQGYRVVVTVTATFEPILPIIPISKLTFNPSSRRTILKDIIIENEPELPPPPPGCRLLQITTNPTDGGVASASPEPNCGATWYVAGTSVTLEAVPNSNYNFINWGGTVGAMSGASNPVMSITMDDNHTAIANFNAIICYQIARLLSPSGDAGTVTVDGATPENCPNGIGWTPGTPVVLNVTENVGYNFDHWEAPGEIYDGSTNNPLIIGNGELDSNMTLTAVFTFTPNCYDVTVQVVPENEGIVNFNPPRGQDCPNGWLAGNVSITAQPNEPDAYAFSSWGGDAASNGSSNPGTLGIDGNKSIVANFSQVAEVADIFIEKSDSADPVLVGQQFNYTLIVGNNGPDNATAVSVIDNLPSGVTPVSATSSGATCTIVGNLVNCSVGFLGVNTSKTINIAVVPNTVGTIQNVASVINNGTNEIDTNTSNNSDTETTTIAPSANLSVVKTGPATANVGNTLTYNIVVANAGPSSAASVVLIDALPLTVSYLSSSASTGSCAQNGTQVICNLGNMPADGTPINITILAVATSQSTAVNQATVSSNTSDPETINNTSTATTVIGSGSTPFITVNPTCASPGETITVKGYNWSTNGSADTKIYWETLNGALLGTVPSGASAWTHDVTVPANATNAIHTVLAYRKQGSNVTQANTTLTVPCPAPDLTISSHVTLLSQPPINQGDPVSFRVTVTNTGVTQAVSQFPVSLYFNPNPAPTGSSTYISSDFKVASYAISGLAVGASRVVTLTAQSGFPLVGNNTVYAVVDSDPSPDGQIDETNETNNISSVLNVTAQPCVNNCSGGSQTGTGILAGQAFVPSVSGELLPQPNVYVLLVGPQITQTQFTFTNNNGTYVFEDLATGSYMLSGCIDIDGVSYYFSMSLIVTTGVVTEQDLLLTEGPCA